MESSHSSQSSPPGQSEPADPEPQEAAVGGSTDATETDKTVISSGPPFLKPSDFQNLHPRDLGRLLEGQNLDQFFLEEFIGGGGMGAVFRAQDTSLHRTVAVKVLGTQSSPGKETERRFELEARSAARLDHPNIARVHYVGEDCGLRYIVFEYIEGTNVRDLVLQGGPLPLADSLNCTLQIADALVHAWQRDVVHRDVKPSNILITSDGQAKLVDMGLARLHEWDQTDHELTASGVTLGTFDYISPEQAREPRNADIRSDIYSLGCTLYFMLAGHPPFPEGTVLQKLLQHQGVEPPNLAELRPDLPESVVEVVETMLAKKVEHRFQTPADLVVALVAVTEQLGIIHPQVVSPLTWVGRPLRWSWLRTSAPWLVPLVLLPLGVLILELVLRTDEPPPNFSELQTPVLPAATDATRPAEQPTDAAIPDESP